jgi:hypothetical protein
MELRRSDDLALRGFSHFARPDLKRPYCTLRDLCVALRGETAMLKVGCKEKRSDVAASNVLFFGKHKQWSAVVAVVASVSDGDAKRWSAVPLCCEPKRWSAVTARGSDGVLLFFNVGEG